MSIGDSMKKLIGIEELDEEEITDAEVEAAKEKLAKQAPKRAVAAAEPVKAPVKAPVREERYKQDIRSGERKFTVSSTNAFKLILIEPRTFEECPKLVDSLKGKKPVIINLEKLETEVARKIFDFLSGATYALDGNVQKVANNIFIFAPANVDITGGAQNQQGFDFTREESQKSDSPWG